MIEEFNDFPWHDAELKEIIIDRENSDIVTVSVVWPDDTDYDICTLLEFFDCYGLKANMNFGYIGPDSIDNATCVQNDTDLEALRTTWKKINVDLDDLYSFKIETISTASEIKIFAKGYRIVSNN